jgi:hypothetical protein
MITIVDQDTADRIVHALWFALGASAWAIIHNVTCEVLDWRLRRRARQHTPKHPSLHGRTP